MELPLRAVKDLRIAMLEKGERKFTYADIGGLAGASWHSPYLLLRAELFDTPEELAQALKKGGES